MPRKRKKCQYKIRVFDIHHIFSSLATFPDGTFTRLCLTYCCKAHVAIVTIANRVNSLGYARHSYVFRNPWPSQRSASLILQRTPGVYVVWGVSLALSQ